MDTLGCAARATMDGLRSLAARIASAVSSAGCNGPAFVVDAKTRFAEGFPRAPFPSTKLRSAGVGLASNPAKRRRDRETRTGAGAVRMVQTGD